MAIKKRHKLSTDQSFYYLRYEGKIWNRSIIHFTNVCIFFIFLCCTFFTISIIITIRRRNNTITQKKEITNGDKVHRKILDCTISNTSNERRLHRFTKRVITRLILNWKKCSLRRAKITLGNSKAFFWQFLTMSILLVLS